MNVKGQGALEYLLLIGGALIVVAVVLTVLPNLASGGKTTTTQTGEQVVGTIGTGLVKCADSTTSEACEAKPQCDWFEGACVVDCTELTTKTSCDAEECSWNATDGVCEGAA